ncbi:hypothetical protein [Glycomyces tarimensis]
MTDFLDRTGQDRTVQPQQIATSGACGRLGSAIAAEAETRGHRVTVWDAATPT